MLSAEAVRLGSLYVQSLHMVAHSQQMARLARDAFSDKLTQFVQSGHNPKLVLSALDDGDSTFSPVDEKLLADFFHWPLLPSSGTSGEKAASMATTMTPTVQLTKRPRLLHWQARPPRLRQHRSRSPRLKVQKSRNRRLKNLRPKLPLPLGPGLILANMVVSPSQLLVPTFLMATSAPSRKNPKLVPLPRGPRLPPRRS
ncbi:hypothetical protein L218DRAFT_966066, partial [Marasmius fiardii PR-910]